MQAMNSQSQQNQGARWSVVVSHQHSERTAKENLENQKFEVYLPMLISEGKATRTQPKPGLVVRPLFSTYLFVRIDPTIAMWRRIFSTKGVKSVFMAGDRPLAVADHVVDMIQAREENGYIKIAEVREGDVDCRWSRGDKVKVAGPTADYDAIFVERLDKNRASILVELLGRSVPKQVHLLTIK